MIRFLSADQEGDRGLESWDLSTFRYPQSPEKLRKATTKMVETLELQFATENGKPYTTVITSEHSRGIEKNEFLHELKLIENVRTADHNEYEKSLREKKKRAAKFSLR